MNKIKHLSVEDFNRKYSTILKVLEALLFIFRISPDGKCFNRHCPYREAIQNTYRHIHNRTAFLCKKCLQHFYPMVDSPMNKTHVNPVHWFQICYLMLSSRNGISAAEVSRRYGYSEKTVLRLMHLMRFQMGLCLNWKFENAVIEVDGAGTPTGKRGYKKSYRFKRGRGNQRNATVLAIRERGQKLKLFHGYSEDLDTTLELFAKHVDKKTCIIITDEWQAYQKLTELGFKHIVINHNAQKDKPKSWKTGIASTNNAEGIFSLLQRNIRGTHINVTDKYFQNYLNEVAFKVSYANEEDYGFSILIKSFGNLYDYYKDKFTPLFGEEAA